MNILHVKSINLLTSYESAVVSGDFCRLSVFCYHCHIDEVKAAHSDFDRYPRRGGLRPENTPNRHFFRP